MKRIALFVAGLLIGGALVYLTMDWRIGAADAMAKVYAVGAVQTAQQLDGCLDFRRNRWRDE